MQMAFYLWKNALHIGIHITKQGARYVTRCTSYDSRGRKRKRYYYPRSVRLEHCAII